MCYADAWACAGVCWRSWRVCACVRGAGVCAFALAQDIPAADYVTPTAVGVKLAPFCGTTTTSNMLSLCGVQAVWYSVTRSGLALHRCT